MIKSCNIWILTARQLALIQWSLILKIQNIYYYYFNTEHSKEKNRKSVSWTKTKHHVNEQIILYY